MTSKKWIISDQNESDLPPIYLDFPKLLGHLLQQRQIDTPAKIEEFLNPTPAHFHAATQLKDIGKAVELIQAALTAKDQITIFGDYDVDGVCSTTILYQTLQSVTDKLNYYLPIRAEGYGLNQAAVEKLSRAGTKLLITVDCGTSNVREIELAKKLGLTVIVIDHHQVPEILPPADALINPHQADDQYPYKNLCGAGVVFKLLQALKAQLGIRAKHHPLDLVAIATVADIVELLGENRTLVTLGLKTLHQSKRPGLIALAEVANIDITKIDTFQIAFQLAPRINAAGRMRHAHEALELMLCDDPMQAQTLAANLQNLNVERQKLTETLVAEAQTQAMAHDPKHKALVITGCSWHPGIVGLIAGKLCEQYHKPVLVISQEGDISRGSARSIASFHVTDALREHQQYLSKFGGHAQAAGFELNSAQLPEFTQQFIDYANRTLAAADLIPELQIAGHLTTAEISYDLLNIVNRLAPFGHLNPKPVFALFEANLLNRRTMGQKRNHFKSQLNARSKIDVVGFGMAEKFDTLSHQPAHDLAFTVEENTWEGLKSLQLLLKDIR